MDSTDRLKLARFLGDAATAVPGVVGLRGGRSGEVTEYGPGGRVSGVAVAAAAERLQVTVSIAARYSPDLDLARLADRVRRAVQHEADERIPDTVDRVDVVVADLVTQEATP